MSELAQSIEAVAYKLMEEVTTADKKWESRDREYILSTYEECLKTVRGYSRKKSERSPSIRSMSPIQDWMGA